MVKIHTLPGKYPSTCLATHVVLYVNMWEASVKGNSRLYVSVPLGMHPVSGTVSLTSCNDERKFVSNRSSFMKVINNTNSERKAIAGYLPMPET